MKRMIITKNTTFLGAIPSFSIHPKGLPLSESEKMNRTSFRAYRTNMGFTRFPNFVGTMVKAIGHVRYFRIHVVGYFYSQKYFDDWCEIARRRRDVTFYSYIELDHLIRINVIARPKNFILIYIKKFVDIIHRTQDEFVDNVVILWDNHQYEKCPKFEHDDTPCFLCMRCLDKPMQLRYEDWTL